MSPEWGVCKKPFLLYMKGDERQRNYCGKCIAHYYNVNILFMSPYEDYNWDNILVTAYVLLRKTGIAHAHADFSMFTY